MAILEGPLYADEARGQLAKVLVFKRSKVHPNVSPCFYHPVNWTPPKIAQALAWRTLCNSWQDLSPADKNYWSSVAPGVLTGFNYFIHLNAVMPLPPCYESPLGDDLNYNFVHTPYDPPSGSTIIFQWEPCI